MATATAHDAIRNIADLLEELGGESTLSRVRLKEPLGPATEADLIKVNERGEGLCELVDGLLVEKGMGYTRNRILGGAIALAAFLRAIRHPTEEPRPCLQAPTG